MFIIFLDIDGVLITPRGPNIREPYHPCVKNLNRLCKSIGLNNVRIVISSTWRLGRTLDELNKLLAQWGVVQSPDGWMVVGLTGRWEDPISHNMIRGREILNWLEDAKDIMKIDDYLVIDDDTFDIQGIIPPEHFLHTHSYHGLTKRLVSEWIEEHERKIFTDTFNAGAKEALNRKRNIDGESKPSSN